MLNPLPRFAYRLLPLVAVGLCVGRLGAESAMEAMPAIAQVVLQQASEKMDPAGVEFFEKNVRPILTDRCYRCHSAQEGVSKGGLIMDTRAGLLAGGDTGAAVVPKDLNRSLMIKAVHQTDPDLSMPPRKAGAKLPDAQIAILEKWVAMGAPAPVGAGAVKLTGLSQKARDHWAFKPVGLTAVPKVSHPEWCQNEIDNFILAKLEENNLVPSAPAEGESLLRRLNYDLIGLPPTSAEVDAFARDYNNAQAIDNYAVQRGQPARSVTRLVEQTVDRLLASPHYGERWARHWLDTARYSDTRGVRNDKGSGDIFPNAWTYRDYVIDSFNRDKPYDQFIVEQLAADRLPDLTKDDPRLAALGFITVGKRFDNPDDTIDERIDTTTKAFLGLTVACARCHDHKFDPIPTADYYSLHGVFAATKEPLNEPEIRTTRVGTAAERADYEKRMKELTTANAKGYYNYIRDQLAVLHKDFAGRALASMAGLRSTRTAELQKTYQFETVREIDTSILVNKKSPITAPIAFLRTIPAETFAEKAPDILTKVLTDPSLQINPLVVEALKDLKPKTLDDVVLAYQAMFKKYNKQIAEHINHRSTPGRSGDRDDKDLAQLAAWPWPLPNFEDIATTPGLTQLVLSRDFCQPWQDKPNFRNNIIPVKYFSFERVNALELTHAGGKGTAMVVADVAQPKNSYVYLRGDKNKKGPPVPRRFLEIIAGANRQPFTEGSGRHELAQAIASPTNPLTARVMVNRLWMHHFGAGIVTTPDDLGNMSEKPSHPELLDWLADNFIKNGWSLKKMHRLMLTSQAYRQSANPLENPNHGKIFGTDPQVADADNRLLWRANLRRLDFESIRDAMILLTGKMDGTTGGRPVNITDEPISYRRSIYGFIDRERLSDLQSQFDFSDPDMTNSRRGSTIVPQQALFFMNNALSIEVARAVSARPEVANAISDDSRIAALYRIMFQRSPKPEESRLAKEFVRKVTGVTSITPEAKVERKQGAKAKLADAKAAPGASTSPTLERGVLKNPGEMVSRKQPISPWEMLAQAMICSNEFVYLD